MTLTALYQQVEDGYVAYVAEIPGVITQGDTLDEARENLRDALETMLAANRELLERDLAGERVIREEMLVPA